MHLTSHCRVFYYYPFCSFFNFANFKRIEKSGNAEWYFIRSLVLSFSITMCWLPRKQLELNLDRCIVNSKGVEWIFKWWKGE